ncbi:MAG: LysR family transcriptional regulator [Kaiparowitsia implicata GSE-PSE-MK54-09C]|jgi:DNA-binding transcriptional LysR family regulator|nr:LysR family transcriptional regulator [Kaiparowitsia implicata GSE-PSE-MK54-09C]
MDWRAVNFDWNQAKAFLATVEEGSLSAAARALKLSQSTLSRQVDALEQELGLVLFERVGKGLQLTPSGQALFEQVRAMGDAATRVSLSAAGNSDSIEGSICISASEAYAALVLPPIVAKLHRHEPLIKIEILASNAASNLQRREADIAIRNFPPTQPDLIARKVRNAHLRLYATPEYLDRIGRPKLPYDLREAEFISIDSSGMFLKGLNALGLNLTERNFPILSENILVMWELVKEGLGIGILDDVFGDAEPRVRRVLPEFEPLVLPVWLVVHRELDTSRRVRVVFDLLVAELASPRRSAVEPG